MKRTKTAKHPCNFLFFDTETKGEIVPTEMETSRHRLWFGMLLAFRYEKGIRTRSLAYRFTKVQEFWRAVEKRLEPAKPLYCFAHNLPFDLTIVDFWQHCEREGISFDYVVMEDPPTFFSCTMKGCKVVFVDTLNYWRCSLAALGESFHLPKQDMPAYDASQLAWDSYCQNDCEIIARAITALIDYLTENDLGKFAMTAPSIAMQTFKHRFLKHEMFVHDNLHSLDLERDSYYGGLVNCFYIGKVPRNNVYNLDVNSLYPSVMINNFPVKLIGMEKNLTPNKLKRIIAGRGACARVDINSDIDTYPYRYEGKLLEVTGTFTTCLCGPELEDALDRGHIEAVHLASIFEVEPIFTEFVTYFWNERRKYKEQGDDVKQTFTKLLMNSLYGKFGQKGYDWTPLNTESITALYARYNKPVPRAYLSPSFAPDILWQQNKWFPLGLDESVSVRSTGGNIEMKIVAAEHSESFPAVAGFVTAYARQHLRQLIAIAGEKNTYYCDTDSLFVNEKGYKLLNMAGEIANATLGKLKLVEFHKHAVFYGPKDYQFGPKEVIKGIREKAICIGEGEYLQNQFEGLKSIHRREPDPHIDITWIIKRNNRRYTKGVVLPNGRVIPFKLQDNVIVND